MVGIFIVIKKLNGKKGSFDAVFRVLNEQIFAAKIRWVHLFKIINYAKCYSTHAHIPKYPA
jgi:hypothetical protein